MTPPEFSVLLLAWDDADPTVAVLGGAALPPTLPLVYQLAAQQPVLAVYPHLPASEGTEERAADSSPSPDTSVALATAATKKTAVAANSAAVTTASEAPADALATVMDGPGVQVFPALPLRKKMAVPALQSRIIGLAELEPADTPAPTVSPASSAPASPAPTNFLATPLPPPPPAPGRSQWPTGIHAPDLAGQWQAPAAPYLGAGSGGFFPPPPPAPPRPLALAKSAGAEQTTALPRSKQLNDTASAPPAISASTLKPRHNPQAGDLNFDPDPELPAVQHPAVFQETTEEIGAGEAADISAPEDDVVPHTPAADAEVPEVVAPAPAPIPAESAAPTILKPRPDGLNFRMIQYARQAAQLVRGRAADFGVIYAPNWPAWLAALEIRNSSGRPLVLYLAGLATDLANPAEHGYQLEMERMAMRRARLILVPDDALRRRLLALYEDAAGKVRVVAADDEAAVQHALGEVALG
ncbi:glycosyltransferase family 4 protein [Hymenobacter negativus]|uniref:Glycosyltransferase n=1 Tax=Hymenobacter negativus TaxID=2795026 RepID=A0ABS0Q724_9BACT|nr:glycosyltransferase [Hymenobacter negativus]MBH8558466.1 glycosyltransferase [Hymenobacter negativus]